MKALIALIVMACGLQYSAPALATDDDDTCSIRMLAGRWLFATGIGHQALPKAPPPGDITASGTMNIKRSGYIEGTFDVTFQNSVFLPGRSYTGSVTVNPDCTATLTLVTDVGTMRTDTVLIVDRNEFWGMSQDPLNLWTCTARRVPFRR
jgi:hypothetical protein